MIAIALTIGVAVAIWLLIYVLRGSLLAGCLVFLLVASCLGESFFKLELEPVPLTLDRIILVPLAAAFWVQRFLGRNQERPVGGADMFLFALLAWMILSTFAQDFRTSLPGQVPPIWRLVAGYLIPAGIYWIAHQSPLDQRRVGRVHAVLLGFGLYLAVTGICEVTGQWWAVFPAYISDPKLGMHFGRARGPMLSSITYGSFVTAALFACCIYRPRWRYVPPRLVLATIPLMLAAICFSYTRSVWLGAAGGLPVLLWMTMRGRARYIVAVASIIGILAGGGLFADRILGFQRDTSARDTQHSAVMRLMLTHVSWKMFQDAPVAGVGFGHFPTEKLPYLNDRDTGLPLQNVRQLVHHNTFLSVLTETGGVGLFLFTALLLAWAQSARDVWRNPVAPAWVKQHAALFVGCLCLYVAQLSFHELTYSALDNSLIFLLAGMTVGMRQAMRTHPPEQYIVVSRQSELPRFKLVSPKVCIEDAPTDE